MADYYSVLKRTLSGFSNPKAQLRTKLYERARLTIKRQLEGRNPPLAKDALTAELDKLEKAISDIEQGYDEGAVAEANGEPVVAKPEPIPESPIQTPAASNPAPMPELIEDAVDPMPDLEIEIPPIDPAPPIPLAPEPAPVPPIPPIPVLEETVAAPVPIPVPAPPPVIDPIDEQTAPEVAIAQEMALPAAPALPYIPPIPEPATSAPPPPLPIPPPIPSIAPPAAATGVQEGIQEEVLAIPPASGFGEKYSKRPKKRGFGKWIVVLFILAGLGAAAAYGWTSRDALIERFGLADLFDNPTRPKPVKTIVIKPDPEEPETQEPEVKEPAAEIAPKSEKRLTAEGVEVEPATSLPATESAPAVDPLPAKSVTATLPIAQSAILYEQGGTVSENSIDVGRVLWSVVQEEPSAGLPKEPAIHARVEIPNRKLIMIMTIKRNADRAFPASHLIELVFAVPDDFSGGGINQINRFVFKENEQGRGEGLVAVPAKIQEGIFLVALTNLEKDVQKNVDLMQTRNWIDIPVQYRTGRSALITIEKGVPGENVFKEVFAAWEKLN